MSPEQRVARAYLEKIAWESGLPSPTFQKNQKPQTKLKEQKSYKRNKSREKTQAKRRYHQFCKHNRGCMKKREEYRRDPLKYKRRGISKRAAELMVYDQGSPASQEITQPGANVGYRSEAPNFRVRKPDEKEGLPPGNAPPTGPEVNNSSHSRVVPNGEFVQGERTYPKQAALLVELFSNTSPDILEKAKSIQVRIKKVIPKNKFWSFSVPGSKGDYVVKLKVFPKGNAKALEKHQIQVNCNCDFFRWQGPEHWAKSNAYLYGKPVGTASKPNVKDPNGKHWACKHVIAVLNKARQFRFSGSDVRLDLMNAYIMPGPSARIVAKRYMLASVEVAVKGNVGASSSKITQAGKQGTAELMELLPEQAEAMIAAKQLRDGAGKFHTTIISPPEVREVISFIAADRGVSKGQAEKAFKQEVSESSFSDSDLKVLGLGSAEKGGNIAYFVVLDWPSARDLREKYGLDPKGQDFHITVGFDGADVHGVRKDRSTLL